MQTAAPVQTITADALAQRLAAGTVAQFWNVLTDDYFTGALIPGSSRVPLDLLGREVAATALARDTPIVVYCSGPSCPQSRAAAEKLLALGFTDVRAFEGGLQAWTESGRAVERLTAAA
jgi:rhodanese-related sulfurtransferase